MDARILDKFIRNIPISFQMFEFFILNFYFSQTTYCTIRIDYPRNGFISDESPRNSTSFEPGTFIVDAGSRLSSGITLSATCR